jgi:siderophore synthetase component
MAEITVHETAQELASMLRNLAVQARHNTTAQRGQNQSPGRALIHLEAEYQKFLSETLKEAYRLGVSAGRQAAFEEVEARIPVKCPAPVNKNG